MGSGLVEVRSYDSWRQQPAGVTLGTSAGDSSRLALGFGYCSGGGSSCSTNNGNVLSQTISPLGATQSYSYDSFNRLASAGETGGGSSIWSEAFGYDDFGNRWVPSAGGLSLSPLTATAASNYTGNNQMVASGDFSYDAAGNQTFMSPYNVTYDGESRQTGITSTQNGSAAYTYDGDGRRVTKTVGGATTVYVYDAAGELAAEYSAQSQAAPCQTCYLTADPLGSIRVVSDQTGTVVSRHDYLPFGEELATANRTAALGYGAVDGVSERFTGQLRDMETGLDWFHSRYFSGAEGRFASADEPLVGQDSADPQSWNLYSYVMGSPLVYTDPDGHDTVPCPAGDANTFCVDKTESTGSDIAPGNGLPAGWLAGLADFWSVTEPGKWLMAVENRSLPQPPKTPAKNVARPDWPNNITSIFGYDQRIKLPSCAAIAFKTAADDLNPLLPAAPDVAQGALNVGQAVKFNQALTYAAAKGLTYPNKSSVFRGILSASKTLGKVADILPLVNLDYSLTDGLIAEIKAMNQGQCQ